VRLAVISLLLARPDYAEYVTSAVDGLNQSDAQRLCILYTAAVILQAKYADQLRAANRNFGRSLPDLFSDELGLNGASSDARLHELAHIHARFSGQNLNWAGTYENAALLLVRRWGSEKKWKA
jgi:hypothetical protein